MMFKKRNIAITMITVFGLLLSIHVYQTIQRGYSKDAELAFYQNSDRHTRSIQFGLDSYLEVARAMQIGLDLNPHHTTEELNSLAESLIANYEGVKFVHWALKGQNSQTIPLKLSLSDSLAIEQVLHQIDRQYIEKPTALNLMKEDNGEYVVLLSFSFSNDEANMNSSFIIALSITDAINSILEQSTTPAGVNLTLYANKTPIYQHFSRLNPINIDTKTVSESSNNPEWTETNILSFAGLNWTLSVTPGAQFFEGRETFVAWLPSLLILIASMLLALFIRIKYKQQEIQESLLCELRLRDQHFTTMVETIPGVVYRSNIDDTLSMSYLSPQSSELTGYSVSSFLTRKVNWRDMIHSDDREKVEKLIWDSIQENTPFSIQYRILQKSGVMRWVYERGQPVKNEKGESTLLYGCLFDVTHRILTDTKFQSLLESAPDMMVMVNENGIIEFSNQQVERILGYSPNELLGKCVECLMELDVRSKHGELLSTYFKAPQVRTMEARGTLTALSKSGERIAVEISLSPIETDQGTWVCASMRDVRSRKEMEKQIVVAKEAAEAALVAKSAFLANMSHELRTPMNAIIGLSHLFSDTELSQKQRDYNDKTIKSANHLLSIINDILDFSKLDSNNLSLEHTPFNLNAVIKDITDIESVQSEEKGLNLTVSVSDKVPSYIMGDPLRVQQILLNLINNAIKFTESGTIKLTVIQTSVTDMASTILFSVEDTGIGISSENVATLFDAFVQEDNSTARKYGGSGLGLSICASLVSMMDGKIWCESQLGAGSQFFVEVLFEHVDEINIPKETKKEEKRIPNLHGKTILLVEDNEVNQLVAKEFLSKTGADILTACDGYEAFEQIDANHVDLVLMDCQMPNLDGYQATELIRQQPHLMSVPIVALTANTLPEERERMVKSGMDDHISKPIEPVKLYSTLHKWLPTKQAWIRAGEVQELKTTDVESDIKAFLDREKVKSFSSGNVLTILKMLTAFTSSAVFDCEKLERAMATQDRHVIKALAHKLKGATSYISSDQLVKECKQIEHTAMDLDWDELVIKTKKWLNHINHLINEAQEWMNELESQA